MSATINIKHGSRPFNPILNFPATENSLSWSFTEEGDGEIYEITTTNVATLTIGGNAVTLPFVGSIAVTNGSSYSVAITKTTNGQTASLSLKTRRAIDKSVTISVPDFGAYDGRYLYVLLNNNTVKKFDSQLLLPSNYTGSGVWTVDPVVATLTLPTLPNSAIYTGIQFVKNNNVAKIFIVGGEANNYKWYASYIRCSDDAIFDLTLTTSGGYTQISNLTTKYNSPKNILYDFISEFLYVKSTGGINGSNVLKLDLNTNVLTNLGFESFADTYLSQTITQQYQFDPILLQFISVGDSSLINNRNYNYKIFQNNGNVWGYRYDTGHRLCTGDRLARLQYFDSGGARVGGVAFGDIAVYSCSQIRGFYLQSSAFMTHINNYAIGNWGTGSGKYGTTDKNLAAPNNYIFNLLSCNLNKLFFGFAASSTGVLSTRMLIFKESETNADFGYYDFANTILGATNTQLLI